jgi:hypothetical protein
MIVSNIALLPPHYSIRNQCVAVAVKKSLAIASPLMESVARFKRPGRGLSRMPLPRTPVLPPGELTKRAISALTLRFADSVLERRYRDSQLLESGVEEPFHGINSGLFLNEEKAPLLYAYRMRSALRRPNVRTALTVDLGSK